MMCEELSLTDEKKEEKKKKKGTKNRFLHSQT
jgi:hypothetical protein